MNSNTNTLKFFEQSPENKEIQNKGNFPNLYYVSFNLDTNKFI